MRKDKTLAYLRTAYKNILLEGEEYMGGRKLSEESMEIFRKILFLVLDTDFFCEEAKRLVKGYCYRELAVGVGESSDKARNKAFKDIGRLKKLIGRDTLELLVKEQSSDIEIERLQRSIDNAIAKATDTRKNFFDALVISLPNKSKIKSDNKIEEKNRELLIRVFIFYGKYVTKLRREQIPDGVIAYLKYLSEVKPEEL